MVLKSIDLTILLQVWLNGVLKKLWLLVKDLTQVPKLVVLSIYKVKYLCMVLSFDLLFDIVPQTFEVNSLLLSDLGLSDLVFTLLIKE